MPMSSGAMGPRTVITSPDTDLALMHSPVAWQAVEGEGAAGRIRETAVAGWGKSRRRRTIRQTRPGRDCDSTRANCAMTFDLRINPGVVRPIIYDSRVCVESYFGVRRFIAAFARRKKSGDKSPHSKVGPAEIGYALMDL